MARPRLRVALLRALGVQTPSQLCQGDELSLPQTFSVNLSTRVGNHGENTILKCCILHADVVICLFRIHVTEQCCSSFLRTSLTTPMLFVLVQAQYGNPMLYVTENGVSEKMQCTELCDDWRIKYYRDYINEMLKGA